MDTNRFQRLAALFEAASDLPPDQREAVLHEGCAGDAPLRAEVEALLDRHDRARSEGQDRLLEAASALRDALVPEAAAELPLPDRIGRYRIRGEIARGGFGIVLRGEDPAIGRDVAVKILPPAQAGDRRLVELLRAEGRISGRLQHPSIVPVYELGQLDGERPFVAMKVVEGRTLAALLRERSAPTSDRPRFLAIFEQVCQAIAYAHSRGVLHRDLKPQNLMVGAFGEVQVMDWGLATVLGTGPATGRPLALGTPAYLAPEQARGEPRALDPRSDVFGLGAILCEILTGVPPFPGEGGRTTLERARAGELGTAFERIRASGADPELVELAIRCLAADPADRPADAGEVARAVRSHLDSREQRTREAELDAAAARARAAAERRARRLTTALGALVVLVTLIGASAWLWLEDLARDRQRTANGRLQSALLAAERAAADAAAERPETSLRWRAAADTALNAERLIEGDLDPQLVDQVRELRGRAEARLRDLLFAERMQAIALEDRFLSTYDRRGQVEAYEQLFEVRTGLEIETTPPDAFAAALLGFPFREQLIATLDVWQLNVQLIDPDANRNPWLHAVADQLDDNAWRREVRRAFRSLDAAALVDLAGRADAGRAPPYACVQLSIRLMMLGEPRISIELLEQTARRHLDDFETVVNLAMLHRSDGDRWQAVRYASIAAALRPNGALPQTVLASALMAVGRPAEAVAAARRALELASDDYGPSAVAGDVLLDAGLLDEVAVLVDDYPQRAPRNHAVYAQVASLAGNLAGMRGDFGAAVDAYLDAVTAPLSWPHDPAWKLHEPQLTAGVRRELEARLAAHPDDPDLRYVEARLLEDLGDLRAALRAFEGIEQAAPGHLHTRSKIGSLLASLGGSLASIAAADRAIERLDRALPTADAGRALFGPDGPDGVRTPGVADFVEGRLFAREGRHADAIRAFERILAGHRDEPLVWEHLHRSHEALAGRAGADAAIRGLLAAGTPPQRPLRIPPARPVPIGPPTGSEASIPVVLAIDGFATADPRHRHAQTVWRVRHVDDDIRLAPRIEVLAEPGLRLEIPDGMLVPGETYAWSAAFVLDGQGIASADCDEQLFVAPRGGASPTPIDLSPHFDRDVIANPGDETGDPFDPPNSYLLVVDGFDGVGLGDPRVAGLPADGRVGPHRLGPYEGPNCARFGSTFRHEVRIDVPRGRYRSFLLLGASGNGTTSTWVRIVYADETVDHVQCVFPDWFSTGMSAAIGPQSLPQPVRRGMDRWSAGGVEQRDAAQVFEMFVAADPDREVVELRLLGESTRFDRPDTTLNLLAITGMRVGAAR